MAVLFLNLRKHSHHLNEADPYRSKDMAIIPDFGKRSTVDSTSDIRDGTGLSHKSIGDLA